MQRTNFPLGINKSVYYPPRAWVLLIVWTRGLSYVLQVRKGQLVWVKLNSSLVQTWILVGPNVLKVTSWTPVEPLWWPWWRATRWMCCSAVAMRGIRWLQSLGLTRKMQTNTVLTDYLCFWIDWHGSIWNQFSCCFVYMSLPDTKHKLYICNFYKLHFQSRNY